MIGLEWMQRAKPPRQGSQPAASVADGASLDRAWEILRKGVDITQGENRVAFSLAETAARKNPTEAEAWILLSRLNSLSCHTGFAREKLAAAGSAADTAAALAPQAVGARLAKAVVLTLTPATFDAGLRQLRLLSGEYPDDVDVLREFVTAFLYAPATFQPDRDEVVRVCDRLLAHVSDDPTAFAAKAVALALSGHQAEAIAVCDASNRRTGSAAALLYKFFFLVQFGDDPAVAAGVADRLPVELAYNGSAARLVGYFWLGQGKPEKALHFLEAYPGDFLEDPYATVPKGYLVGKAYAAMDRPDAAKLEWTRALEACDRRLREEAANIRVLAYKCALQHLLGDPAAAQKSLELVRQLGGEPSMDDSGLLLEIGMTDGYMAGLEKRWMEAMASDGGEKEHKLRAMQWRMQRAPVLHPQTKFPDRFRELADKVATELKRLETPAVPRS